MSNSPDCSDATGKNRSTGYKLMPSSSAWRESASTAMDAAGRAGLDEPFPGKARGSLKTTTAAPFANRSQHAASTDSQFPPEGSYGSIPKQRATKARAGP